MRLKVSHMGQDANTWSHLGVKEMRVRVRMEPTGGGLTASLVGCIGIPNLLDPTIQPSSDEVTELFFAAKRNKIPLLFLQSIRRLRGHSTLDKHFSDYWSKQERTVNLISLVSGLLERRRVCYALFKTLKPFPHTPADIDVLLWSKDDLAKACVSLEEKGFKPSGKGAYGLTMVSHHGVNIDLTTEIAASGLIYLNKNLLLKHVGQVGLNGFEVNALQRHADLVAVAAHCLYKEQMYTLNDYYTFATCADQFNEARQLAQEVFVRAALDVALALTYTITLRIFGVNVVSARARDALDAHTAGRIPSVIPELPVKYRVSALAKALSKKFAEDPLARASSARVFRSMFTKGFYRQALAHVVRQSY